MGKLRMYPGEKVLEDDFTVFCGEWYLVNGKPYRSYYGGTVAYLVKCLKIEENEDGNPVWDGDLEIKYCNKFARRLS